MGRRNDVGRNARRTDHLDRRHETLEQRLATNDGRRFSVGAVERHRNATHVGRDGGELLRCDGHAVGEHVHRVDAALAHVGNDGSQVVAQEGLATGDDQMLAAGIGQGVDNASQLVQRKIAPRIAGVHCRVAADAVQVAMVGDVQVRRLQRRGRVERGHVGALGCGAFRISGTLHVFLALGTLRACGIFHAFSQGPFVDPLRTFPHCHAIGTLPFHDEAATTQMNGQIRIHRGDLCFGHVLGEHAVAHGGAFGSQADNIASRGVADHGDGKGSVLHYVRAEPHCTLLCASWDSAVSMRQTQGLECRI